MKNVLDKTEMKNLRGGGECPSWADAYCIGQASQVITTGNTNADDFTYQMLYDLCMLQFQNPPA